LLLISVLATSLTTAIATSSPLPPRPNQRLDDLPHLYLLLQLQFLILFKSHLDNIILDRFEAVEK